jgi:hypothetical protein
MPEKRWGDKAYSFITTVSQALVRVRTQLISSEGSMSNDPTTSHLLKVYQLSILRNRPPTHADKPHSNHSSNKSIVLSN